MSSMPGEGDGAWFFPYGLDRETYDALRAGDGGDADRAFERDAVTSTARASSPAGRQLAESVVEAGRAAVAASQGRGFTQKELWEVHAHIAGRIWLGVHLLDGGGGLSEEERAGRQAYVTRLRDELRAIAELPAHDPVD
ncbi:hypothetical protein ACH41E_33780 [Streptomyces sp. NPDC020412]|uniref:hypothetical protein n=1 Tax=Streptomyces sp. NPDC020412 TaxID=3365073 RepID=UPI0037B41B0D